MDYNVHKLILGTHTSGEAEQNHLMLAEARLPTNNNEVSMQYDEADAKDGSSEFLATQGKVETIVKINHQGEVHRARYMPQSPNLIATKSPSAEVYVFNTKEAPKLQPAGEFTPEYTCEGHSSEGWALCWSPHTEARLVSGSDDTDVCMWDLQGVGNKAQPLHKFTTHTDVIEDVAWHAKDENLFASVSDDKFIYVWDVRDGSKPALKRENAHEKEINSVQFNPFNEHRLVTGSSDTTVVLWDSRNLAHRVHECKGHKDEVFQVSWNSKHENIIASCGADRRVIVWDAQKIGQQQTPEFAKDGPPELLFIHGGHTNKISEISWITNPAATDGDEWYAASVAEDNILQIWHMAEPIYAYDDDEDGALGTGGGVASAAAAPAKEAADKMDISADGGA